MVAPDVLIATWAGALAVVRVLMESVLAGEVLLTPTLPATPRSPPKVVAPVPRKVWVGLRVVLPKFAPPPKVALPVPRKL